MHPPFSLFFLVYFFNILVFSGCKSFLEAINYLIICISQSVCWTGFLTYRVLVSQLNVVV